MNLPPNLSVVHALVGARRTLCGDCFPAAAAAGAERWVHLMHQGRSEDEEARTSRWAPPAA